MIEVLALASAVSTVAGGISSAVQAGKDVGSVLPQFGKLAKLEADIHLAEKGRHKGPLGRLTSTEEEGFAIANAKMNEMRDIWNHAQLEARNRWRKIDTPVGRIPALLPPGGIGTEPRMDAVPALGEHTASLLAEIGYSEDDIAALQKEKVI